MYIVGLDDGHLHKGSRGAGGLQHYLQCRLLSLLRLACFCFLLAMDLFGEYIHMHIYVVDLLLSPCRHTH